MLSLWTVGLWSNLSPLWNGDELKRSAIDFDNCQTATVTENSAGNSTRSRCTSRFLGQPLSPLCPARNAQTPNKDAKYKSQANRHQHTHDEFGVMRQTDYEAKVLGEPGNSEHP